MKLKREDIDKYATEDERKILEKKKVPPMLARLKKKGKMKKVKEDQHHGLMGHEGYPHDEEEFKVGDKVTFMSSRGNTVDGIIIKRLPLRAVVQDIDSDEIFHPQYSQLAKLDDDFNLV